MVMRLSHLPESWWKTFAFKEFGRSISMDLPLAEMRWITPLTAWFALKLILDSMPLSRQVMPA